MWWIRVSGTERGKGQGAITPCPSPFAAEVGGSEPLLTKRVDQALCKFSESIRDALVEAKRLGHVPRGLDVRKATDAILAYFEGVMLLAKTRNDPSLIRRLGPMAVHLATHPQRKG